MKHIISSSLFSRDWVDEILERARGNIETARSGIPKGNISSKATVFIAEPSTRTGGSYREAARLVGCPIEGIASGDITSLVKGETLGATGRMFAGQNTSVLPIRTKIEGGARWLAEMFELDGYDYPVAVQNCGDGANEHPTQALLDLLTITEKVGRIDGLRIGFVGDLRNSRTVHSLVRALGLYPGISLVLVSSESVRLPGWYTRGLNVTVSDNISALTGCNIVYVTRVQEERFGGNRVEYERVRGKYSIRPEELKTIGDQAMIMHPQPINQHDQDIDPRLWRHPQVIMDLQARMGIPVRMALIEWSLAHASDRGFPESPAPVIEKVIEKPAEEARRQKEAQGKRFMPISRGTVLDHIEAGKGEQIRAFVKARYGRQKSGAWQLVEGLQETGMTGGKDTILLENAFLDESDMAVISVLSPGVTINVIENGTLKKLRVVTVSDVQIGQCPNSDCVTNLDIEAALYPRFSVSDEEDDEVRLVCHYCERHFHRSEVIR